MDPAISIDKEKIALELKFLLSLKEIASQEQTLQVLNTLYPFSEYPLGKLPPLQLQEFQPSQVITPDLRTILDSYALIVVVGKVRAQSSIYFVDEQHLVDDSIREEIVYDFDKETTELRALGYPVTLLKVHKIWVRIAKDESAKRQQDYVRKKLMQIPFFQKLQFEEFSRVLKVAKLHTIGPGDTLLPECTTPYNMYIITEGELVLHKQVKFAEGAGVWRELQLSLQKKGQFSGQLFQYLVRQPTSKIKTFDITFQIANLGQGSILCGTESLNQIPLGYSIHSSLKSKYIAIKYPDLYVLEQGRLDEIRGWPTREIDKKQLRRQYYYQKNWSDYKEYLVEDQELTEMEAKRFEDFLRKEVNLAMKRYSYSSDKVGEGCIVDSPALKMCAVRQMAFPK